MSKKIHNYILRVACFISIGLIIFYGLGYLLMQKRFSYREAFDIGKFKGFYDEEDNSIDVIIAGTSHAAGAIAPMELYEKYGIKAYNLATGLQPIEVTYYMLCEALKTQSPKVLIYDVGSLYFSETSEYYWRFVLDDMKMGKNKLEFASEYCQEYADESKSLIEALFPVLGYHTRWKCLAKEDFVYLFYNKHDYGKGGIVTATIVPSDLSVEYMNEIANELSQDTEKVMHVYENGVYFDNYMEDIIYNVDVTDKNAVWLKKLQDLCDRNHIELLAVKVPSVYYPQTYRSAWTDIKYNKTRELCDQLGIAYYDLLYDADLNIDWEKDTFDGGCHLNLFGAQKVSEHLGSYLAEHYKLLDIHSESWDKDLLAYKKMSMLARLELEQELTTYVDMLLNEYNDKTILIAASDDMAAGLDDEEISSLRKLGLKEEFSSAFRKSYIAFIENGNVKYEASSNHKLSCEVKCDNFGRKIELYSSGWWLGAGASIKVEDTEVAFNGRGMNIVVYDDERNLILDSVCFNTCDTDHTALRDNSAVNKFKKEIDRYISMEEGK